MKKAFGVVCLIVLTTAIGLAAVDGERGKISLALGGGMTLPPQLGTFGQLQVGLQSRGDREYPRFVEPVRFYRWPSPFLRD